MSDARSLYRLVVKARAIAETSYGCAQRQILVVADRAEWEAHCQCAICHRTFCSLPTTATGACGNLGSGGGASCKG